jgi:hypothetical protein
VTLTSGTLTPGTWTGAGALTETEGGDGEAETEGCGAEGCGAGFGGLTGACGSLGVLTGGAGVGFDGFDDGGCGDFALGVGEGPLPPSFPR